VRCFPPALTRPSVSSLASSASSAASSSPCSATRVRNSLSTLKSNPPHPGASRARTASPAGSSAQNTTEDSGLRAGRQPITGACPASYTTGLLRGAQSHR
jgi:hypothetical protein